MKQNDVLADAMRGELVEHAKTFKTSWVYLGQTLYTVWRDKTYYSWGHEKFEDYVVNELGLKKPLAMKLLKTYFFVEQEEPGYLTKEFSEAREASVVPSYESLDVLRLARKNKDLKREDYIKLRKEVFEKGKDASLVRKDLTTMIKERKQVDPDEERERRHQQSVKRFLTALKTFKNDIDALKLIESDIAEEAEALLKKLEEKYL
jgi:hypothetical protein